jgi:hypothetical protein
LAREEVSKMIQEAEENAMFDQSKKALVNVTYELDNTLSKLDKLEDFLRSNSIDSDIESFLFESFQELQFIYQQKEFKTIPTLLKNINYGYNLLLIEYFRQEFSSQNGEAKPKGKVIDVTGQ